MINKTHCFPCSTKCTFLCYLFSPQASPTLQLWVSHNREQFQLAHFPSVLPQNVSSFLPTGVPFYHQIGRQYRIKNKAATALQFKLNGNLNSCLAHYSQNTFTYLIPLSLHLSVLCVSLLNYEVISQRQLLLYDVN